MLTFDQIKELIELVSVKQLEVLEIERAGFRLRIGARSPRPPAGSQTVPEAAAVAAPGAVPGSGEQTEGQAGASASLTTPGLSAAERTEGEEDSDHVLHSPIVGTFYRGSGPEAGPYVEVGQRVKQGQVLCIVEAMKLMNEIESDCDGVVVEVLAQNAQPVEYGEPLFRLRLAGANPAGN